MTKVIEEINPHHQQLMRLADAQQYFLEQYAALIPDDGRREDFRRELIYLIHLTYREAAAPLVQQLTDFLMSHSRPVFLSGAHLRGAGPREEPK